MEYINQWVTSSDKFAVVIIVLFIIFIGVSALLLRISNRIKN